ncbi:MAG: hypothetical protein MUO85_11035 [candidate division Zixibacteria bacterium]|nr:hypothetical protein [candidate division Zixibacteria bacterium]
MNEKFREKYRIPSARLLHYNYSKNGVYFVTICTKNFECYLGEVVNDKMILSEIGKITDEYWREIPKHFPFVKLDAFVVMPNHLHGILIIDKTVETQNLASLQKNKFGPQSQNLASIVRGFKIGVKKYAVIHNISFGWQPRFYDHIIRNNKSLNGIREYIQNNPLKWELDKNNIHNLYI